MTEDDLTFQVRLSVDERIRVEAYAYRHSITEEEAVSRLMARAAAALPRPTLRTQAQVRAEQRATSPDGKSTYTREIPTTKEHR